MSTSLPTHKETGEATAVNLADIQATAVRPLPDPAQATPAQSSHEVTAHDKFVSGKGRKRWALMATVLVLLGLAFWITGNWRNRTARNRTPPVRVAMKNVGLSEYVFNGRNVSNFKPIDGNWVVPPDDAVIAGTDGSLAGFLIHRGTDNRSVPLVHYRLEALIDRRTAKAAWLQFAIAQTDEGSGSSWGIKLSDNKAELVRRNRASDPWLAQGTALNIDPSKKQLVVLERNPAGWYATIGETALGYVPFSDQLEIPEFRLGAEGGEAWFSDLLVTELRPATE